MTGSARAGDFDFLAGSWTIRNRRLKTRWASSDDWETFDGAATCHTLLGGAGSIEELSIPPGKPLGLRLLDAKKGLWNDYWVSAGSGLVLPPPMSGRFIEGAGVFVATGDRDGDIPIHSRGVWDRIGPASCCWTQSFSRDGGATWEVNWAMEWTRVR
ncbi:MAG: DUF1579 domain-containing protein [Rubrivivax sp.]